MATVLQRDITDALQRLRDARAAGSAREVVVCERRLNWLLDRLLANRKPNLQKSDYGNATRPGFAHEI